jgi:predicted DNA-binding transcriptional regulator YafY
MDKLSIAQLDRLVRILMLLRTAEVSMTSAKLALELEIPSRTVARDLKRLRQRGVPVLSQRGDAGGVWLDGDYRRDLAALSAAVAKAKLKAMLQGAGPNWSNTSSEVSSLPVEEAPVPAAPDTVVFDPLDWAGHPSRGAAMQIIATAIATSSGIRFRAGNTRLIARPLQLRCKAGAFYLIAATEGGMCVLPVINLYEVQAGDTLFDPATTGQLEEVWARESVAKAQSLRSIHISVQFDHNGMTALQRIPEARGKIAPWKASDYGTATGSYTAVDLEAQASVLMPNIAAGTIKVLEPPELTARTSELAERLACSRDPQAR